MSKEIEYPSEYREYNDESLSFWSSENLELEYVEDKQNVKTLIKSLDKAYDEIFGLNQKIAELYANINNIKKELLDKKIL
jgi:ppGpp synthetase/RelA/SpoT-type nucleotidyltranferase